MKRSVAVVGPTPAFMRWSVWHPCPFRDLEPQRYVDLSFRRLRGIRAWSDARQEGRCRDGFCFHPEVHDLGDEGRGAVTADAIRGFAVDEVLRLWGGAGAVESACRRCPAQLGPASACAGCFGFLSVNGFDLERRLAGYVDDDPLAGDVDLPEAMDRCRQRHPALARRLDAQFPPGGSVWHRLWSAGSLSTAQLTLVVDLLGALPPDVATIPMVQRFRQAAALAAQRQLSLRCDALPPGHSDGEVWRLPAHCGHCGIERQADPDTGCPGCGRLDAHRSGVQLKVLGLRPYVRLSGILGREPTVELVRQYRRAAGDHPPRQPSCRAPKRR